MPKPKKNEAKQDYLKRCTAVVMQEGKSRDQAYATCNSFWDDAHQQRRPLALAVPLELQQPAAGEVEETAARSFLITAYTGQIITRWWGRPLIIDVAGLKAKNKIPVLREHARDRVVGFSTRAWKEGKNYFIAGDFSKRTMDGQEVLALAEEGFPWQASIGVIPEKIKILDSDKESLKVNGREIQGPAEIWLESQVGEVSFVALGADDQTAAIVLGAEDHVITVPVTIERAGAQIKEDLIMELTLEQMATEAPDLLKQIQDAARAEGFAAGEAQGREQERRRTVEILEAGGLTGLGLQVIRDGVETKEALKLFLKTQEQLKAAALEALTVAAIQPKGQVAPDPPLAGDGFEAKVTQFMVDRKISRGQAIKAVVREFPELHQAYLESKQPQVK